MDEIVLAVSMFLVILATLIGMIDSDDFNVF